MRAIGGLAILLLLAGCGDRASLDAGAGEDASSGRELVFKPDLMALRHQACAQGNVSLPVPGFGALTFRVEAQDLSPGRGTPPCAAGSTASVALGVLAVEDSGSVHLDAREGASASLLIGEHAVYGGISVVAREGAWGPQGPYEAAYDALDDLSGTLAWLRCDPQGCHSTDTI